MTDLIKGITLSSPSFLQLKNHAQMYSKSGLSDQKALSSGPAGVAPWPSALWDGSPAKVRAEESSLGRSALKQTVGGRNDL